MGAIDSADGANRLLGGVILVVPDHVGKHSGHEERAVGHYETARNSWYTDSGEASQKTWERSTIAMYNSTHLLIELCCY